MANGRLADHKRDDPDYGVDQYRYSPDRFSSDFFGLYASLGESRKADMASLFHVNEDVIP